MLLASPIIPFSSEETFMHAYGKSMYSAENFIIPASSRSAWVDEMTNLRDYSLLFDLKDKLTPTLENIYKDVPRRERRRLRLVVVHNENSQELAKSLENIGVDDLAEYLELQSVKIVSQQDYDAKKKKTDPIRAAMKFKKAELKVLSHQPDAGQPLTPDSIEG